MGQVPTTQDRAQQLRGAMASILACVLIFAATVSTAVGQELQRGFETLRQRTELGVTRMSVIAVDGRSGRVLLSHHADEALIPASNMKLLTSGAALKVLGPEFVFETRLVDAGNKILLVGSGDPSLGDPAVLGRGETPMTLDDLLDQMVRAVTLRGITRIEELVVDDRVFDRNYAHPSWPADQLNRAYCAEVAGVNLHANVFAIFTEPASGGRGLPQYTLEPAAPWVQIENLARTVTEGRQTVWVARPKAENKFQIRGDVRHRGGEPVEVAFHEPPLVAGRVLANRLLKAGVQVGLEGKAQGLDAVRLADPDERLASGQPLVVVKTAMEDVLRQCNTESHNLYAEALIKRVANEVNHESGSWESGAAVLRMLLSENLGPDAVTNTRIADGSGMSRDNAVSASTLAAWLRVIGGDDKLRQPMLESLATPGNGTLRTRFGGMTLTNDVYAKSGYLNGVRSLSGYVVADDGRTVVFSMIMNDIPAGAPNQNTKLFMEQCVNLMDDWLAEQATARLGG